MFPTVTGNEVGAGSLQLTRKAHVSALGTPVIPGAVLSHQSESCCVETHPAEEDVPAQRQLSFAVPHSPGAAFYYNKGIGLTMCIMEFEVTLSPGEDLSHAVSPTVSRGWVMLTSS